MSSVASVAVGGPAGRRAVRRRVLVTTRGGSGAAGSDSGDDSGGSDGDSDSAASPSESVEGTATGSGGVSDGVPITDGSGFSSACAT